MVLLVYCAGCQTSGSRRGDLATRVDRLMNTYPDLRAGRFVVIADFEEPKHMELFRTENVSGQAACTLDRRKGRAETGTGCMLTTLGSADDAVVISNANAEQWSLKRDWRPYDMLLMSAYAPKREVALHIAVAGGAVGNRLAAETSIELHRGWNVLRLDLSEIGERVPLDDIQEVRLAMDGGGKPVQLRVDDIVLTASREDLLGDSRHRDQGLYVQRVGRRWRVGAAEFDADFELTFANGQIVEWHHLGDDPYRLHNLVKGTTLGPNLVGLGADGKIEPAARAPGEAVVVRSKIVEMSPVRVVVTSEWRFVDDPSTADSGLEGLPYHRWVYTIYPTGQLYVGVDATTRTESRSLPPWGLAVSMASEPDAQPDAYVGQGQREAGGGDAVHYGVFRSGVRDALLLFVPDSAEQTFDVAVALPAGTPGAVPAGWTSFIATSRSGGSDIDTWACHLLLSPASRVPPQEALARVEEYTRPAIPELQLGRLPPPEAGTRAESGFDPVSGCYNFIPEEAGVRFVLDGTRRPWFSPVVRILGTDNRDAWVYVDHLVHDRVARDAHGNLLFQMPGKITHRSLVEVVFRSSEGLTGG